jgi:hypothetical protein
MLSAVSLKSSPVKPTSLTVVKYPNLETYQELRELAVYQETLIQALVAVGKRRREILAQVRPFEVIGKVARIACAVWFIWDSAAILDAHWGW